jgi:hypothetical protein
MGVFHPYWRLIVGLYTIVMAGKDDEFTTTVNENVTPNLSGRGLSKYGLNRQILERSRPDDITNIKIAFLLCGTCYWCAYFHHRARSYLHGGTHNPEFPKPLLMVNRRF